MFCMEKSICCAKRKKTILVLNILQYVFNTILNVIHLLKKWLGRILFCIGILKINGFLIISVEIVILYNTQF